jgi:RNA polymerase sigma-70 factor (ECF subfamily)
MALVRLDGAAAFRVLVVRHALRLATFCGRMLGDRASAPEVAQDVWLALWDARRRWEPTGRFSAFLYTIAFSRCRNAARARRRRGAVFSPEPLPLDAQDPARRDEVDRLLEAERRERLWEALGTLPTAMREAVLLRFVEDLSYDEIERVVDANASTVRSRVHHALRRLRDRLGSEEA